LKTNTVTDEETTEHDDEGEAERPRRGSARKFSEEAPKPSKATKEEDHILSPSNFLKRTVPTTPKPSQLKAPTGAGGKAGDDEEEEDSMESVYSMFLGDDKRSPTSEQKVIAPVEVEVESSSGEHLYSDEASEERGKKGSSDTSEVEIIDVDALPARKGAGKRKKAQTRREPGNKADATPGFKGRKRQRTTIADIQQELEERDNDAAIGGSASRFRSRQRAVDRRKSASTAKPEVRPHFDADVDDDDDEYSTVFVGGSSEEEREAERTRKTDRRRKEADELRAFRVLLKEGAIEPPQDEEGEATDNESQRPGKPLRGEGETPGRPTPLLRLPYAVATDALRAGGERKERNTEYARVEVVRKKDERAVLPGHECEECAKVRTHPRTNAHVCLTCDGFGFAFGRNSSTTPSERAGSSSTESCLSTTVRAIAAPTPPRTPRPTSGTSPSPKPSPAPRPATTARVPDLDHHLVKCARLPSFSTRSRPRRRLESTERAGDDLEGKREVRWPQTRVVEAATKEGVERTQRSSTTRSRRDEGATGVRAPQNLRKIAGIRFAEQSVLPQRWPGAAPGNSGRRR
jgi:hypothetical protein